jgi:hypothetical protein
MRSDPNPPFLWQEQLGIQGGYAGRRDTREEHTHLTIGSLPHTATPLIGDANAFSSGFEESRFVDHAYRSDRPP